MWIQKNDRQSRAYCTRQSLSSMLRRGPTLLDSVRMSFCTEVRYHVLATRLRIHCDKSVLKLLRHQWEFMTIRTLSLSFS